MWPVRFSEAARAELIDAQDWYEAEALFTEAVAHVPTAEQKLLRKILSVGGNVG